MELQGKVVAILEPQTFNGRNGAVTKFGFVIETEGQYAKKVHFQVFGEDKWAQMQLNVDMPVVVSFDVSSREWNGKWFTQCDAWRTQRVGGQQAAAPAPSANAGTTTGNAPSAPAPTSAPADDNGGQEDSDNLPF